jgi:hypothetical protein
LLYWQRGTGEWQRQSRRHVRFVLFLHGYIGGAPWPSLNQRGRKWATPTLRELPNPLPHGRRQRGSRRGLSVVDTGTRCCSHRVRRHETSRRRWRVLWQEPSP